MSDPSLDRRPNRAFVLLTLLATLLSASSYAESRQDEKLVEAMQVVEELANIPERGIPPALLDRAYAIAVIPDMIKGGIGVAGRHGRGVLSVRQADGWSAPVFIKMSGGSVGWQAGLQTSDVVLVFTNERGVRNITRGKFTLGADASIAAGPIGRHGTAATDARFSAEVYSYSRARGLFAGIAIDGASLRIDDRANAAYYVQPAITAEQILAGDIRRVPDNAVRFARQLPRAGTPSAVEQPVLVPADAVPTPTDAQPATVTTYGMGQRPANADRAADDDE